MFIIDLCHHQVNADSDQAVPREEAYFAGANITDIELQAVGRDDRERRAAQRKLQAEAANRNIGLGHDLRAGIMQPTPASCKRSRRSSAGYSPPTTQRSSPTAPAGPMRNANAPSATPAAANPNNPT